MSEIKRCKYTDPTMNDIILDFLRLSIEEGEEKIRRLEESE